MKYCKEVINEIEKLVPNSYYYKLMRDPGVSGRFEITVYSSQKDLDDGTNGTLMHSKENSGSFPKGNDFYESLKAKTEK